MKVRNVHERRLTVPAAAAGELIESLAGPDDRLWPAGRWPAMRFDRPLGVGATGGHGPVRYHVEEHEPGVRVRFRFVAPAGFEGFHEYAVLAAEEGGCTLRHALVARMTGPARVTWPLFFRPLHDALIEDSLDRAAQESRARWSPWVRLLRHLATRTRRPS